MVWLGAALASDGTLSGTLPATAPPGTEYKVRVVDADTGAAGMSDGAFTVLAGTFAAPLTVTSPNGGETLTQGQNYTVTWNQIDVPGYLAVYLNTNGVDTDWLGAALASDGQWTWAVPGTVAVGGGYKIHLVSASLAGVDDMSDAAFTVVSGTVTAPLTVTSPNGGETLTAGQTVTITWTAHDVPGLLAVYVNDNGVTAAGSARPRRRTGRSSGRFRRHRAARSRSIWCPRGRGRSDMSDGAFTITHRALPLPSANAGGAGAGLTVGTATQAYSATVASAVLSCITRQRAAPRPLHRSGADRLQRTGARAAWTTSSVLPGEGKRTTARHQLRSACI